MANILLVDDKEYFLTANKMTIEDSTIGANVYLAKNEDEAKKILNENSIDLIITDLIMLTDTSGMDVLKAAKEKDPLIMVIIITAYEKKLDRIKAFELGAFDCLEKGTPGVKADQELVFKARNALRFRETALQQIETQKKLDFLKRYFDPKVFHTIESNPDLLSVKNRLITIVFWDIRGFSLLSEILKAHPTLISGFLKEYFEISSKIIFKNQGVLDKFIGDGVMAIFGALNGRDRDGKQDALSAVSSAIEFKKEFDVLYKKWMEQWVLYTPQTIDIGLGCGIHTGEALVGNMGTDSRDHFTAIGPHVNFTQRIESETPRGKIRISASTKVRVQGHFNLVLAKTENNIKNIPGTFDIFEIVE